jgi:hypothetical protein
MRCPNCGSQVPDTARACGHCGQWLAAGPAGPPPAATPPKRGVPGWAWGLVGGVVVAVVAGVLLITGVINLPSRPAAVPPATPVPAPVSTVPPFPTLSVDTPTVVAIEPTHTSTARPTATPSRVAPATPTATTTPTLAPSTSQPASPTAEAPVSAGPLDFPEPTRLDAWEPAQGGYRATIIVHIEGGAPPFAVYHDLDRFETAERDYPLVFITGGCTIIRTITVESADGQRVSHDYYIRSPWCD